MPIRRALVECVVLSLQGGPVFYPCCKGCFSKINVEQRDRCRCLRCGSSCSADLLGYRYRLALKVAREGCIFALTVFGTSLNPFFGIDASGLQRLAPQTVFEDASTSEMCHEQDFLFGTATRSTILLKAVQDCFTGRHLIFGIKVLLLFNVNLFLLLCLLFA
uniref:Replication factor A C-terminal domain-containing protein n=1 Tax=Tetraodon nigroviridis TaxID=99883 RepID=H3CGD4_TETNG